jgi:NAD(P)-dependent dehydrogenase (short-subunit alcohol dehydrogenase family)
MATNWTQADIPDLAGRTILVTGANSGLGYETARELAAKGATTILACRDGRKAESAIERIKQAHPQSIAEFLELDLADLSSVRRAAASVAGAHQRLDALINNAGVMALPYTKTVDGFELQLGVCHFGHFALTGLLLDLLNATPGSRVVTVASGGHIMGRMDFDNLQWERNYRKWPAYGRAKLANLLFTFELQRRLARAGSTTIATAAHPGSAGTNLGYREPGTEAAWIDRIARPIAYKILQSAAMGALPTLRAATDPSVLGGEYYGPEKFLQQRGYPVRVGSNKRSRDEAVAAQLWQASEQLTGVTYRALNTA